MLAKQQRLTRAEFKACFTNGVRRHSSSLTVVYCAQPATKVAVVVGKKVYTRAHERNRLRRSLYGEFRSLLPTMRPGVYIVMAKPAARSMPKYLLRKALGHMIGEVNKIR